MAESQSANGESSGKEEHTARPRLVSKVIGGRPWPKFVTMEALNAIRNYDVRNDDVWVITFPKSGTNWVCEMVQLIHKNGNLAAIDQSERPRPIEFQIDPAPSSKNITIPKYVATKTYASPRTIHTHISEEWLPRQICEGKGKVIYVLRNPKDVAVSWGNFCRLNKPSGDSRYQEWDDFFKMFLDGQAMNGSWFSHVLDFWTKHKHADNFLFIKYEDMQKDSRKAVTEIAGFLGFTLSDDTTNKVVEGSSLSNMKERFFNYLEKSTDRHGPLNLIRKGIVGSWKTQFTVAQNELFDNVYREQMKGSQIKMDFEI